MQLTAGDRVFAYLGTPVDIQDGRLVPRLSVAYILGPGTYQGDETPPDEITTFNLKLPTEKIVLDTGKTVWGCECWIATLDAGKDLVKLWRAAGFVIKTLDIDEARKDARR